MATPQELMRMFPQFAAGDITFADAFDHVGDMAVSGTQPGRLAGRGSLSNVGNYYQGLTDLNPSNYFFSQADPGGNYSPNQMNLMIKTGKKEGTVVPYSLQNGQWLPDYNAAKTQVWDTGNSFQNMGLALVAGGALGSAFLGPGASAGTAVTEASAGAAGGFTGFLGEGVASGIPAWDAALKGGSSMLTVGNMMRAGKDILGGLNSINSLLGQGTTTGSQSTSSSGTRTSQTELTPEAIMRIVQMAMENPSTGLQSILNPAAGAGTFGGSNQALLTSELLTRVAGEAALKGAKTTETAETTGTTSSQTKNRSPIGNALRSIGRIFGF